MGNYLSSETTEEKVKNMTWAIESYIYRDGYKSYKQLSAEDQDLMILVDELKKFVLCIKKNKVDNKELLDILEYCKELCEKYPTIGAYELKSTFDAMMPTMS